MKRLSESEAKTAKKLLLRFTKVLPEGFRVDLSEDPDGWAELTRALGSRRLCAFVAETLSKAYRKRFSEAFLFSIRCMTFEFMYHLNAYLCVKGYRRTRHVTTLLFKKAMIERKCFSIEIDTGDVYRLTQRVMFRAELDLEYEKAPVLEPATEYLEYSYVEYRVPTYNYSSGQSSPSLGYFCLSHSSESVENSLGKRALDKDK